MIRKEYIWRNNLRRAARSSMANGVSSGFLVLNVSRALLVNVFGLDWAEKHLIYGAKGDDYVADPDLNHPGAVPRLHRIIDLAEMIFNLQWVDGFDDVIERLRGGQIGSAFAELESGKLLWRNRIPFRFNRSTGVLRLDYDLLIMTPDGVWAAAETKSKITSAHPSENSIFNLLNEARKQLPNDMPGFIFLRVPQEWFDADPAMEETINRSVDRFFASTRRVVSVKLHTHITIYHNTRYIQIFVHKEYANPRSRYKSAADWRMFPDDPAPFDYRWHHFSELLGFPRIVFVEWIKRWPAKFMMTGWRQEFRIPDNVTLSSLPQISLGFDIPYEAPRAVGFSKIAQTFGF